MNDKEKTHFCECPYPYIKACFGGKKDKIICYLKWLKKQGKESFTRQVYEED